MNKWTLKDVRDIIVDCDNKMNHKSNLIIKENKKLKSTIARYICKNDVNRTPICLEIGSKILNVPEKSALIDVIKHEYAHYYSMSVLRNSSGHDNNFRTICKQLGTNNYKAKCDDYIKKQLLLVNAPTEKQEMAFYNYLKKEIEKMQQQQK